MWRTDFLDLFNAFLISILLIVGNIETIYGQDVPFLKAFSPEEYGSSPQNWSIQLLSSGIVIANSSGILTFDGEHWASYPAPGNHQVRAVLHVQDTIYSGSYGEFGFWTKTTFGKWVYRSLSTELDYPLTSQEEIWHIAKFPGGILFQSFSTIYLLKNGVISIVTPPYSTGIMFASWWQNSFYLQVIGEGIARFDPTSESFELICNNEDIHDGTVVGLLEYRDALLIGTDTKGLFIFRDSDVEPIWPSLSSTFATNQLNKIIKTGNQLILGTILDGVLVVDSTGSIVEHLNHACGLPDNTVLSLLDAGEGKFWVGFDNGLAYINLNASYRRFQDQTGEIGVIFDAIEHNDHLYLGTNHGLFRQDRNSRSGRPFSIVPGTQGQVWSLKVIQGELYCGHNSGTLKISNNTVIQVSPVTGAWSWLDTEDGNWIQGTYTGLVSVNRQNGRIPEFKRIAGFSLPIRDLVMDQEGWIWGVAPYKGLYRLKLNQRRDSVVQTVVNPDRWGLPEMNRLTLARISDHLLVKTDSGWFQLNDQANRFHPIREINQVTLDADINQIRQISKGICTFRASSIQFHNTPFDQVLEIGPGSSPPALLEMEEGSVFIGRASGYVLINTHRPATEHPPGFHISSLDILRNQEKIETPLLNETGAADIKLLPGDIGVSVAVSSGIQDQEQLYRYRSGKHTEWSDWTYEASFTFPIISYGTQVITIQRKSDGQIISLTCYKSPPWYLRTWSITLLIGLFGALNYLGIRAYQRRSNRRWKKKQIERERARHAREIERKNRLLQANLEEQNQELAGITMNLVRKNEAIFDMREQLKKLRNLDPTELSSRLGQLQSSLNSTLSSEKDWEAFEYHFTRVHPGFFTGLKRDFPSLTSGDLRLAAYLRMNLSSKEIAPLLHITVRSLENRRYRLRKKLGLSPDQQIIDLLLSY